MADTLSFGYLRPANGDPANAWQPAINSTITQVNDHDHDGSNSANISPASITALLTTISVGDWGAADGDGNYTVSKAAPAAISEVNNFYPKVFVDSDGAVSYLSITRVDAGTISLTTNTNVAMTISWR